MNQKHAYLIIAHNQFDLLKILIKALDYKDNDIYIHIDAKVQGIDFDEFHQIVTFSNLYILKKRLNVKWGTFTQVECELLLLQEAIVKNYQYYHLLSGVDLPLKRQDEIHKYFNDHRGIEFVHFDSNEIDPLTYKRISKYHFLTKRNKNMFEKILFQISMLLQVTVDRCKKYNLTYRKGANWFSITNELAHYIIDQRELIHKVFKHTLCCDEIFLQTLIMNSEFKDRLCPNNFCNNYASILYYIDWSKGNPYEFKLDDYDDLIKSDMLFARKFNWHQDREIIFKIYNHVIDRTFDDNESR